MPSFDPINPQVLDKLSQVSSQMSPEQQDKFRTILQEELGRPLLISEESLLGVKTGGGSGGFFGETNPPEQMAAITAPLFFAGSGGLTGLAARTAAGETTGAIGEKAGESINPFDPEKHPYLSMITPAIGTIAGMGLGSHSANKPFARAAELAKLQASQKAAFQEAVQTLHNQKPPLPNPTVSGMAQGRPIGQGMPLKPEFNTPVPELGKTGGVPVPQGGSPLNRLPPHVQEELKTLLAPKKDFVEGVNGKPMEVPEGMGLPDKNPIKFPDQKVDLPPNLIGGKSPVKVVEPPKTPAQKAIDKHIEQKNETLKKVVDDLKKKNKKSSSPKGITTQDAKGQGIDSTIEEIANARFE